jgi:leucyl/phenylalanyl-tRNA--protein transferase
VIPSDLLVSAYATGWFPMSVDGAIQWFSPDPRGIIPLDGLRVSKRLARVVRQGRFRITVDTAFVDVMRACAAADGLAHSVEAWRGDRLVGGLYGVALRGAFFGESMFHRETDASKVALVALVERLRGRGYVLLDTQWTTPHLESLGAIDIPRRAYLRRLERALTLDCSFG